MSVDDSKAEVTSSNDDRVDSFGYSNDSGKLPCYIKLVYGMPDLATGVSIAFLITVHGLQFYLQMGATLAFLSFFTAIARSCDVMTDPLMGWWTDTTRSKYGRRRPYIIGGCVFFALFLVVLMTPPMGAAANAWFGPFYVAFFLFDTLCSVPYKALGPELSDDYDEQSNVFLSAQLFSTLGMLFAAGGPVAFKMMARGGIKAPMLCEQFYRQSNTTVQTAIGDYHIPDGAGPCLGGSSGGLFCFFKEGKWYECGLDELEGACGTGGSYLAANAGVSVDFWEYTVSDVDAARQAFTAVACTFGLWFIVTQGILVATIKERQASVETVNPPLVPSVLRCFKNMALRPLLIGWAFDALAVCGLASMFTFFVIYVVVPDGHIARGHGSNMPADMCLAFCLSSAIFAAILSMPMWLYLSKVLGKYRTWLLFNVLNAMTNLSFLVVNEGDPRFCISCAFLNGIPAGAQFLANSILADVIAYDEFLNGCRSEGAFMVFGPLIQKIVAIPGTALPLAVVYLLGFQAPIEGVAQPQPDRVKTFIRYTFVVFPFIALVCGMVVKLRFPIRTRKQNMDIAAGIVKHLAGESAVDPITGKECAVLELTREEEGQAWVFENFSETQLAGLLETGPAGLVWEMRKLAYGGLLVCITSAGATGSTFSFLFDPMTSIIPIIFVVILGPSICFTVMNFMRLSAANALVTTWNDAEAVSCANAQDEGVEGSSETFEKEVGWTRMQSKFSRGLGTKGVVGSNKVRELVQRLIEHKEKGMRSGSVVPIGSVWDVLLSCSSDNEAEPPPETLRSEENPMSSAEMERPGNTSSEIVMPDVKYQPSAEEEEANKRVSSIFSKRKKSKGPPHSPDVTKGAEGLDAACEELFKRYDLDCSGVIRSPDDLQMLTTNLCFRLNVKASDKDIEAQVNQVLDDDPTKEWDLDTYKAWYKSQFIS